MKLDGDSEVFLMRTDPNSATRGGVWDSTDSQSQRHVFAIPSPEGRGCREAAVDGYKNEKTVKKDLWYPSPGPLARATLSLRARDCFDYSFLLLQFIAKESCPNNSRSLGFEYR